MIKRLILFVMCLFWFISLKAQTIQPFKAGDRVVFMGNSITDGGHYHSYIWLYYMTRFPNMRIKVFNAGIGGDISQQMYERIDSEVFAKHPTVMTLTFGMNDTGYQNLPPDKADSVYKVKIAKSVQSFDLIVDKLKQHPEIKKIMIASPPYDEISKVKAIPLKGKNAAILKIVDAQRKAAQENGWGFVDFNAPLLQIIQREDERDSTFTFENADRIHPGNDGQMVMAVTFLTAQGLCGKKVADIVINPSAQKLEKQENCVISGLNATNGVIKFNYMANSLPYPIDTLPSGFGRPQRAQSEALKLIPFTNDFNQELLKVKGLKTDGMYELKIDGNVIGQVSGADLSKGINLALLENTPQYQQALAVMHLNEERWEIERRLREYYWIHYSILKPKGLLFNDSESTMDSLQKYAKKDFFVAVTIPTYQKARFKSVRDAWIKEMNVLTDQIYTINKPVMHQFEITLLN